MLVKTIKYTDYNGTEREEDFYFNLTEAECVELETSISGGLSEMIQTIVKTQDMPTIVSVFKDFIMRSYGEKSLDGKRFIKVSDTGIPLNIAFSQTEAFSALFMELATNPDKAAEFFNGIIPNKTES